jgi:hypothetical protein
MFDGRHRPIQNRTENSLAIALSVVGRGLKGSDDEDNVNNVQCHSSQNSH